ncbi:tail sheath protein [Vibrio phage vB_VchM_Kuja]|uniref:Tail sheath protein n=1 Tax=Vibrio phage vB_VchM_Kuja TaxID=2686437 RepID=A0A6B9JI10_9CAUD|nr:tail sheath protein [Vibrio phage vB_VchM_Kuja]QGZ16167.1 tail sheath protein [Vibrio phage vB_VchM_Kuja]
MSAFSVAPSVQYTERDATLYTANNNIIRNAMVGIFGWGPIEKGIDLTGGEQELISKFYKPTNKNYVDHMIAIDYMTYSNALTVVRVEGLNAVNAVSSAYGENILVKNEEVFTANPDFKKTGTHFMARYAGELGNSLLVSVADHTTFPTWEFRNNFEYSPEAGEYNIAVVDTVGSISGFGGAYGAKVSFELSGTATVSSALEYKGYGEVAYTVGQTAEQVLKNHASVLPAKSRASVTRVREASEMIQELSLRSNGQADITLTNNTPTEWVFTVRNETTNETYDALTVQNGQSTKPSLIWAALVASVNTNFPLVQTEVSNPTDSEWRVKLTTPSNAPMHKIQFQYPTDIVGPSAGVVLPVTSLVKEGSPEVWGISYYEKDGFLTGGFITNKNTSSGIVLGNSLMSSQGSSGDVITGESYSLMKLEDGARKTDGSNANFEAVVNQSSNFIYFVGTELVAGNYPLSGGVSDSENASRMVGYDLLRNAKRYRIKGIVDSAQSIQETQRAIDVAVARRDCVAIWAPSLDSILSNPEEEHTAISAYADLVARATSYQFGVDNWGYMYDRYNDKWRWVPCTGGTAGKRALNMQRNGPWVAFSYYNRGKYSNYSRLAWSADDDQRAILYSNAINSIIYEPGEGFVLMGTKTGLKRPSSFSRINVRDLFIMMEQDIAAVAKYFLGENNTVYTRSLFRTTVEPYMRNLKDLNGVIDYRVKVDETNNNAQIVAENKFVAGIFVKAPNAIDWIWLDFAALRADMSFEEMEGVVGIAQ